MKSYILPAILSLLILTGCSSSKKTTDYDDVYYSTRQEKKQKKQEEMQTSDPDYYVQNENSTTDYYMEDYDAGEHVSYEDEPNYTETSVDPNGTTYVTNNYYGAGGYDDYYDYSYSARINRFYNPYMGFSYYSPCYVGYYYDPWYSPYWYSPSLYFSFGWGYPYYGNPYNNYWYGYNNGYYNGYWDGYYASNDYGSSSYYYGPRTNGSSSNGSSGRQGNNNYYAQTGKSSYDDRNRPQLSSGIVSTPASVNNSGTGGRNENTSLVTGNRNGTATNQNTIPSGSIRSNDVNVKPKSKTGVSTALVAGGGAKSDVNKSRQNDVSKNVSQEQKPRYTYKKPKQVQTSTTKKYQPGESINTMKRTNPSQKYSKPASANTNRNTVDKGNAQRSSAVYSKPKSNSNSTYSRPSQVSNSNSKQPARSNTKSYSQPSRSNTKSYSQPSRTNTNYSKPSNSGSSRSSYSRPSNSGSKSSSAGSRSFSSPSRSSSSGSGGRSSSSSSRGKR